MSTSLSPQAKSRETFVTGLSPVRARRSVRTLASFLVVWLLTTGSLSGQEFRAAFADIFHAGMRNQADVDTMVSALAHGRYNAVVVQVLGYMDNTIASHGAHWKSNILPWSSRVTASFDPLAYLCQQAHANGIEVHAWIGGSGAAMYRVSTAWPPAGNALLASHPEWFIAPLANSEGGAPMLVDGFYILDMGSPDVQEYMVSIVRELVTNYPIDGINWDDEINGAGYNAGFNYPAYSQAAYPRSGLARFRINTGATGTPANNNVAWSDYRRRFKNELMARVQAEIQSIKTNPRQPVRHTTAPLSYGSPPGSCNFTTSTPYLYFSDWATMLQRGWVDAAIPQTYSTSTFNAWNDRVAVCWTNRPVFPGLGGYMYDDATTGSMMSYTRSKGLKGNVNYSYAVPNSTGTDWYGYVRANLYTNVVSTPPMPWRNPATATEGIVWGRLKDNTTGLYVDDATVTVTGATTVKTDGNGYYIATMVPATAGGTARVVTATKGSAIAQTNAIALAGDVVRYDLFFNAENAPAVPTALTATAVSMSTIHLSWNDNATNETGYVVARGTASGGPYVNIANLPANRNGFTNNGLATATTYYYVVRATNAGGSSLNSGQASATTFADPFPVITLQPQSQTAVISNGVTLSVSATGSAPLSYQWLLNGATVAGASSSSLAFDPVQYSDGGNYSVIVSNGVGTVVSSNAVLTVLAAPVSIKLTNIWNIQAGSRTYVTSNNTERGICINPVTGNVLLVSRSANIPGNIGIFVLDGNTGAPLGNMNIANVNSPATFVLNKIDVADDGVVYAANLTTASGSSPFVIYRWSDEASVATIAYSGAPDNGATVRWGDSFCVSGSGINTRILASGSSATSLILFTTTNGVDFVPTQLFPTSSVAAGEFSRGLQLMSGNTFYSKNRNNTAAKVFGYQVPGTSANLLSEVGPLDGNMLSIAVLTNHNLLAGVIDDNTVNNSGHSLKVYDISDPNSAQVVSNFFFLPFGAGVNSPNINLAASVDTDGTRIVGLDTQNGIVALRVIANHLVPRINSVTVGPGNLRQFRLNVDPGHFLMQGSSDLSNWLNIAVTRTNGVFQVADPVTNSPFRFYRTKGP